MKTNRNSMKRNEDNVIECVFLVRLYDVYQRCRLNIAVCPPARRRSNTPLGRWPGKLSSLFVSFAALLSCVMGPLHLMSSDGAGTIFSTIQ